MIQRIQSVYLALMAIVFAVFSYINEHSFRFLSETSFVNVSSSILASFSLVLSIVIIFLYKNRGIQLRLIWLNMVLVFAAIGLYIYSDGVNGFYLDWPFYLLPLGLILQFLAKKGVQFDENLIRSSDRLR
jgi:peptidoglycan/LPS O-acetylase OafA/YrhL